MGKYVSQEALGEAIQRLKEFKAAVPAQGVQHVIPYLALRERGVDIDMAADYEEADDFSFWDRYFLVDSSSRDGRYYDPIAGERRIASHPHSNVATARKSTFVRAWAAAAWDPDSDSGKIALSPDVISILVEKCLTKGGVTTRVPAMALATWMFRGTEFEDACLGPDVLAKFFETFRSSDSEQSDLFETGVAGFSEAAYWSNWVVSDDSLVGQLLPTKLEHVANPHLTRGLRHIVIPETTERLIRPAMASSHAVMLVGPPGTGKTALVDRIVRDAQRDPETLGLSSAPHEPVIVTPDESWGVRELLGGDTVTASGEIVFQPGYLLRAIAEDRWLVMDEANRADLDRIFGATLTWLSRTAGRVEIGRVSNATESGSVFLGWSGEATSRVVNGHLLGRVDSIGSVEFLAGDDWRLLGTYNAVDAQRVFRLGHALGRRFIRIPIPPIQSRALRVVLETPPHEYAADVVEPVVSAYEAHLQVPGVSLGPAVFIRMAELMAEMQRGSEPLISLSERIADAYLLSLGPWLPLLDDDSALALQVRLEESGVLANEKWLETLALAQFLG
jgi:MoxR-like ATPase